MAWRRNFLSYAAVGLFIFYALPLLAGYLPFVNPGFVLFPPLSYVLASALAVASAWLVAPSAVRGWWVARYGLGVLLAWLLTTVAMVVFPQLDPAALRIKGRSTLLADLAGPTLFVILLWPVWLAAPIVKRS